MEPLRKIDLCGNEVVLYGKTFMLSAHSRNPDPLNPNVDQGTETVRYTLNKYKELILKDIEYLVYFDRKYYYLTRNHDALVVTLKGQVK